jgi:hypothetical protein
MIGKSSASWLLVCMLLASVMTVLSSTVPPSPSRIASSLEASRAAFCMFQCRIDSQPG